MANSFLLELGRRAPQLVLAFLAARQSPEALSAFQGGMFQRQQQDETRTRQAQLDEERRAQQQIENTRADRVDQRAAESQRMQRLQQALTYLQGYEKQIGETATDPAVAENAYLSRATSVERMFGVPSGQLGQTIPNMTPAISARKKKLAQDTYERAEKLYGAEAMAGDSITLQTEAFGDVKPSQLRALFAPPAVTATGSSAKPVTTKPDTPNTTEEQHIADALAIAEETKGAPLTRAERSKARLKAVEEYARIRGRADDRPTHASDPEIALLRKDLLRLQVERAGEEKEPNQAQYTAATYAGRMEQAERTLGTVQDAITKMNLPAFELQTNSWFAKPTFQSQDVQAYMQAARNFINAVLRRESGAVISPSEFSEAKQQYLPQPGDTTEALANKAANRSYVFETMKRASGSAYQAPPEALAPLTKDARVGGVYLHNGKKVRVREKTRTGFLFDEVTD